ncbi:hypothetical protein RJ640_016456 [Escallonia rubra]|uniref:Reverse transcriptase domain-containing protein n=1 Tax=Escallonia rubra TaxID=112253 RepID=A0AA88R586_9ASTE|nr:hypothetical protein RJ640_016456 [Escallonia rubra]
MQELVHKYRRQGGQDRCALKLDLVKGFDTANRPFLFATLEAMNFLAQTITCIKECVATPMFSINLNEIKTVRPILRSLSTQYDGIPRSSPISCRAGGSSFLAVIWQMERV